MCEYVEFKLFKIHLDTHTANPTFHKKKNSSFYNNKLQMNVLKSY